MSWIDKVNQWALKGIRLKAVERVETDDLGSTLIQGDGNHFIRWSDVQEIAVLKQPSLARGSFAVAIRGAGSTLTIVDDTVAGFAEFCQEITRRLKDVVPYETWAVELTASPQQTGKVIFRRTPN
jgi:homoserine kinase